MEIEPGTSWTQSGCVTNSPLRHLRVSIVVKMFHCLDAMGRNVNKQTRICGPHIFNKFMFSVIFLAHLSTKCSGWAIVTGLCPSSVVVRRPPCVVRCASCVVRKLFYLNIFSSETTNWILTKLHRNGPWVIPYQSCSNGSDWLHM